MFNRFLEFIRFLFFILLSLCIAVLLISPIAKTGLERYAMYTIGALFIIGFVIILLAFVKVALRQLGIIK